MRYIIIVKFESSIDMFSFVTIYYIDHIFFKLYSFTSTNSLKYFFSVSFNKCFSLLQPRLHIFIYVYIYIYVAKGSNYHVNFSVCCGTKRKLYVWKPGVNIYTINVCQLWHEIVFISSCVILSGNRIFNILCLKIISNVKIWIVVKYICQHDSIERVIFVKTGYHKCYQWGSLTLE